MALLAGTILLAPAAHAARMTLSGEDLDLSIPCTGQVKVVVDPGMKDGATLDSSSMAQVAMHTGKEEAESRISIATKACAPNGKLTISISPSTGLTIHDSHDTHFIITGKLASLDASLDSTTMEIEDTQSLDLNMQGASSVHIKALERAAQIVASGTSTLTADTAQLAALSAQLTQNAGMTLSGGSIDALTLITADQASATILGHATVATVAANGTGDINIEAVSGPMVRSGKGTVRVGAQNGVIYRPTTPPPTAAAAPSASDPLVPAPAQPPATGATSTIPAPAVPTPAPVAAPAAPIAPQAPVLPTPPTNTPPDNQQGSNLPTQPSASPPLPTASSSTAQKTPTAEAASPAAPSTPSQQAGNATPATTPDAASVPTPQSLPQNSAAAPQLGSTSGSATSAPNISTTPAPSGNTASSPATPPATGKGSQGE
ncbi:hypothetical protein AD943_11640 [Gluconobacter roseus]|nr:hypothetical protein AD943_11640 [Gluconobacter roseus]